MVASIDPAGRVRNEDCGEVVEWESIEALARDYWRYQRLNGRTKEDDAMVAASCIFDLMARAVPQCLEVVQCLVDLAEDDELGLVGASELEDLLHLGLGAKFIDGIVECARKDRRFALAIAGVWLSDETTPEVNARLAEFGARFPDGRRPS